MQNDGNVIMNNSQKGKAFERWDRDGVAQHRNLMHEIAMKKQITMYQREEKILERELREISKVKETLLQIRAPLRRRVRGAELEEYVVESSEAEKNLRKTSVAKRKVSVARTNAQQNGTITTNSEATQGEGTSGLNKTELTRSVADGYKPLAPTANIQRRKVSVVERGQLNTPFAGGQRIAQRKISAPAFLAGKTPVSERGEKTGFLPVIKTPNPPPDCSPSVKRKSPLLERPLSAAKNDEVEYRARSQALLTPIAPSKVDMALFRAKSVPCELPSHPVSTPRAGRQRQTDAEEVTKLTMEETLRIKGKFRQIGHSVIATALLKGLKQKGQLSSEAIHNMHKPVFLGEESETKNDENKNDEVEGESNEQSEEGEEFKQGNNKLSFRKAARKAINVNRMLSLKNNNRRRSQSDPENFRLTATTVNSRPKTVLSATGKNLDKGTGQEKTNDATQSKNSSGNGVASAKIRRRDSATEFQQDTNSKQQDLETDSSSESQQMYKKQSVDVDPFRPLMNPRTAHARRRKNTLSGDTMKEFYEKTQNSLGDVEPQVTQADDQNTGHKTVRFAADAWS